MDSARQIVRWALPGWMMLLFWMVFITITATLHESKVSLYWETLSYTQALLVPLGAAAIPMGFIIYQIYYWVYWYVPIPSIARKNFADPVDRGREILSGVRRQVDFKIVFDNPLVETESTAFSKPIPWIPFSFKSVKTMTLYRKNWHLAESAWYLALSDERYKNTAEFLEKRNQFLGDIYHSLGACYNALFIAYLFYLVSVVRISVHETPSFITVLFVSRAIVRRGISVVLNTIILITMYYIFRSGRIASFDALLTLKHDVITNVMLNKPTRFVHSRSSKRLKSLCINRKK